MTDTRATMGRLCSTSQWLAVQEDLRNKARKLCSSAVTPEEHHMASVVVRVTEDFIRAFEREARKGRAQVSNAGPLP